MSLTYDYFSDRLVINFDVRNRESFYSILRLKEYEAFFDLEVGKVARFFEYILEPRIFLVPSLEALGERYVLDSDGSKQPFGHFIQLSLYVIDIFFDVIRVVFLLDQIR